MCFKQNAPPIECLCSNVLKIQINGSRIAFSVKMFLYPSQTYFRGHIVFSPPLCSSFHHSVNGSRLLLNNLCSF